MPSGSLLILSNKPPGDTRKCFLSSWSESSKGRVEHQKLNQVAASYHLVKFLVFNSITQAGITWSVSGHSSYLPHITDWNFPEKFSYHAPLWWAPCVTISLFLVIFHIIIELKFPSFVLSNPYEEDRHLADQAVYFTSEWVIELSTKKSTRWQLWCST